MAKPLTLEAIEAECRNLGLTDIRYTRGAKTADRPGAFTPHGITIHITAGGLGSRTEEQYIRDIINGDPHVPLKANAVGAPDGTLWLNAVGNANHALYYGSKALTAALNASFPLSGNANYRGSLTKWSQLSYGIEMIAASGSKVTRAQRRTALIWAAAIARLHGWTGQETHGHGEVSYDRGWADPGINMGTFRRDVMALVKGGPQGDTNTSIPTDELELDMDEATLRRIVREESLRGDHVPRPEYSKNEPDAKRNPTWRGDNTLHHLLDMLHETRQEARDSSGKRKLSVHGNTRNYLGRDEATADSLLKYAAASFFDQRKFHKAVIGKLAEIRELAASRGDIDAAQIQAAIEEAVSDFQLTLGPIDQED